MKKQLKYQILGTYPKGDSRKYDIDNPVPLDGGNI